jgi:hypothetical protein
MKQQLYEERREHQLKLEEDRRLRCTGRQHQYLKDLEQEERFRKIDYDQVKRLFPDPPKATTPAEKKEKEEAKRKREEYMTQKKEERRSWRAKKFFHFPTGEEY